VQKCRDYKIKSKEGSHTLEETAGIIHIMTENERLMINYQVIQLHRLFKV